MIKMGRIDTTSWRAFRICDIFCVKNAHSILWKSIDPDSGPYPYVTASESNNSVVTRISYDLEQSEDANTIMIGGKTLVISFQPTPYFSNDSHNLVLKLKCEKYRNKYVQLFLTTVLQADLGRIYSWGDSISSRSIQKDFVLLPSTDQNDPDYEYMEKYMQSMEAVAKSTLSRLLLIGKAQQRPIETESWKDFSIGELFDVVKGTRLTRAHMVEGSIRYIGASAFNNGITAKIANDEHLHPGNTITVSYNGSVGEAFYQDEEFWASDDVNVLYPKFSLNRNIALFMIPIIKKVGEQYIFIDKWKKEDMERDNLKLPVKSDGSPDYEYMEAYIGKLLTSAQQRISLLQQL